MDARVRWLQVRWPTTTTMLELPISLGVIGAMALVAAHSFVRVQQHLHVLEAVSIAGGATVRMMEYRAVTGDWPASNEQAANSASLMQGGRLGSVLIRSLVARATWPAKSSLFELGRKEMRVCPWHGVVATPVYLR
jgi:type II secretory pathway pseudopilin PulG